MIQTLEWTDKGVRFIDQTKLPTEETYVTCKNHEQVADAIRNMVVRGAPAIGVAAAMGIALGMKNSKAETGGELKREFDQICEVIGKTRPTAVNLSGRSDACATNSNCCGCARYRRSSKLWSRKRSACTPKISPPTRLWDATAQR